MALASPGSRPNGAKKGPKGKSGKCAQNPRRFVANSFRGFKAKVGSPKCGPCGSQGVSDLVSQFADGTRGALKFRGDAKTIVNRSQREGAIM